MAKNRTEVSKHMASLISKAKHQAILYLSHKSQDREAEHSAIQYPLTE